jgi:hypothetical protein
VVAELEELELEDELGVVVDVGVLVVVVVVVVLEDELELVEVVVLRQSRRDSDWTVCAPWPRFCRSVGETVTGSLTTASLNCLAAFAACPQFFADTA